MSVAMPVDDSSHVISEPRMVQEREVIRSDGTGTVRLVFEMSAGYDEDKGWPKTEAEWLERQQQDEFCKTLIDELAEEGMKRHLRPGLRG